MVCIVAFGHDTYGMCGYAGTLPNTAWAPCWFASYVLINLKKISSCGISEMNWNPQVHLHGEQKLPMNVMTIMATCKPAASAGVSNESSELFIWYAILCLRMPSDSCEHPMQITCILALFVWHWFLRCWDGSRLHLYRAMQSWWRVCNPYIYVAPPVFPSSLGGKGYLLQNMFVCFDVLWKIRHGHCL